MLVDLGSFAEAVRSVRYALGFVFGLWPDRVEIWSPLVGWLVASQDICYLPFALLDIARTPGKESALLLKE